jgi:3-phosphoshikimate 1-carboxyvinyltransferase
MVSLFNGGSPSRFQVEADASSGSYFWAANSVLGWGDLAAGPSNVSVRAWPQTTWQIDARFKYYARAENTLNRDTVSRAFDLGDSIMTAIAMAPLEPRNTPKRFTDLGRLRVQECERVVALRTELTKCGAMVVETGDTLEVHPSPLHGATIETYNDHRMAMCFAVLGLRVPGIQLRNPGCVKKTFPNFFQKLAAAPPHGLGARILDGHTGQPLANDDLFAG